MGVGHAREASSPVKTGSGGFGEVKQKSEPRWPCPLISGRIWKRLGKGAISSSGLSLSAFKVDIFLARYVRLFKNDRKEIRPSIKQKFTLPFLCRRLPPSSGEFEILPQVAAPFFPPLLPLRFYLFAVLSR